MKTPMQELLERVKEYRDSETSPLVISRLNSVCVDIVGMLEKEKEVIVRSFMNVSDDRDTRLEDVYLREFAEDYYNETFNTKDCKIIRCEDPMVCLRGCSVHEQTCKHPIYER